MEFNDILNNRFSTRQFKNEHLPKAVVDRILTSGHKAPTGCNFQPQRILVLNTDESLEKLKGCTRCHFNAPTAMLVCHNKNESWIRKYDGALSSPVDAAIVATHMMLACENEGVGCCFVMHFDPEKMRSTFNIPENIEPTALLVMGYKADDAAPIDMHFKKRPMGDVVFYESF